MSPRLAQLEVLLTKSPNDPFLLYAAALEYKKLNQPILALEFLAKTLAVDPNYMYAYYQQGQILETQNKFDEAKVVYEQGIARAKAAGDTKALSELQLAFDIL